MCLREVEGARLPVTGSAGQQNSAMVYGYQMVFLVITYIVPMTLMSVCYTVMGRVLWGSRSIGELTQRQIDSIRSKRKVVKMFILVVLIFGLCWLPYHSYFIYIYFDTKVIYSKYTQHVYLSFYWFAMSNAMVNPLIYYWMNARFRQYFKTAICGWRKLWNSNAYSNDIQPNPRHCQHSNSKSGAGHAGEEKQHRSHYPNGSVHHPLLARTNAMGREHIRRVSVRTTRTTSLKHDNRKTTYL